ncbi:MAG: 4'-phosphopantetheinyl transferase superfamily protein [Rhodospirillales bacterium]|nr:4'-phosphopantetheinyl transferase superfamily protein [Rhodospirillales bacterium]
MAGDSVVLWWLEVESVAAADWPRIEALLDDTERARARRFHFERDRLSYMAAHALARGLLSAWAGGEPSAWRFTVGPHGKPEVLTPVTAPRLRVNLSHTRGLAAAVVAEEHDVGIDVEWLDRRPASGDLARRFFAPVECAQLEALPPAMADEAFLSIWTLKEAYIKAIGKGLAQPLDSFAFILDPLAIRFEAGMEDDAADWLFRQFRPTPRHLMALALRHPRPHGVTITASAVNADRLCRQPEAAGPGRISRR